MAEPGPSRRHSNVEPASEDENVNCGDAFVIVPVGPESIVVFGAVASTVNVRVAGDASTLPAASVARTLNVYAPSASEPRMRGDVHDCHVPAVAPVSRRHSNVEPVSLEENVNVGEFVVIVPVGPVSMVVFGAAVSTVNVRVAGVGSGLPAEMARTEKV